VWRDRRVLEERGESTEPTKHYSQAFIVLTGKISFRKTGVEMAQDKDGKRGQRVFYKKKTERSSALDKVFIRSSGGCQDFSNRRLRMKGAGSMAAEITRGA